MCWGLATLATNHIDCSNLYNYTGNGFAFGKGRILQLHILDLHVGRVGGEVQKNILSALLWAPANVGEKHCLVSPERLVASQEYTVYRMNFQS